ncbi:MAG: InlB B-repeat-containing protein [Promethearchaeia archaeon]
MELEMKAMEGGTTTPAPGTHSFDKGKEITVKAEPDTGYEFTLWEREGDAVNCEREEKECTFEIDQDSMLAAHFTEKGVVEKCDNDTECGWVSVNCCPENAGAKWECVNKEETNIDCSDDPVCLQVISPKPETSCICSNGECQEED